MKVLAIGANNRRLSINRMLATYAAGLVPEAMVETLDIADYEMPIFSGEREAELGKPPQARAFHRKIREADSLVISFAEHNGSYTAAWKNLFDWASRIDMRVFQGKPALYLATSRGGERTGGRGAVRAVLRGKIGGKRLGTTLRGEFRPRPNRISSISSCG